MEKYVPFPSRHCMLSPSLAATPNLRRQASSVSVSTAPWLRLRPHTAAGEQKYTMLYGPPPPHPRELERRGMREEALKVAAAMAKLPPPLIVRREIQLAADSLVPKEHLLSCCSTTTSLGRVK